MNNSSTINWDWRSLADVIESDEIALGRGNVISKVDIENHPGDYPIYSSSASATGMFGKYGRYMFDEELITWSVDGGGKPFHRPKHKFSVTNVCGFLKIKDAKKWDYRFVAAIMREQHRTLSFDWLLKAHPSVIRDLYRLPAIPLREQRRIAEILDTLDDQIRATEQIIAKLKYAKQGALADFMTRGVADDGSVRAPYEKAPDLYIDRGAGPRPKTWIEGLLDDFAIRGSGHTPNKNVPSFWNGGIKWVSLADSSRLDQLYIHDTDKEISADGIANSSAVLHPAGTVILSRDAGVGKSSILSEDMAVSQHFMAWKTGPKLVNTYLYCWLQHMKREFEAIAMGSTIKTIGLPYFRKLRIFVPSLNEQERIAECLLQADRTIDATSAELMGLRRLKDGLMSDLLAGRVRVPTEVAP